ncbi:MAG: response regulator transcription factor [Chloroflexi bacterium]|nr:response regulator transcription factor [Chloroflexota bacterium]
MVERLSVLVFARYPAVRAGLRELLVAAGLDVVDEIGANEPAAPIAAADVLVADLAGPASGGSADDGVDAFVDAIAADLPAVYLLDPAAVIALGDDDEPARGWLPRDADGEHIAAAARAVAAGMIVIDPLFLRAREGAATVSVVDAFRERRTGPAASLTDRELDVLRLVASGLPNKGIALTLGISEHTVKFHLGSVLAKLDAHSRTEAVTIAARTGLLAL